MIALALIILTISTVHAQIPGIKLGFTDSLLTEFKNSYLPYLQSHLTTNSLFKVQYLSVGEGVLKINLNITNPTIVQLNINIPDSGIFITTANQIEFSILSLTGYINFGFGYDTLLSPSASGNGFVDIYNSNLIIQASLINKNGDIFVSVSNIDYSITQFSLKFSSSGDASFLNKLSSLFSQKTKSLLENSIEYLIMQNINSLNNYFVANDEMINYKHNVSLSYALVSNPLLNSNYVEFDFNGVFVSKNAPNYSPAVEGNTILPNFVANAAQIQVSISEYTLNTLAYVLYNNGVFNFSIDSTTLPKNSLIKMNTYSLNYLIPGLASTYGPMNHPCSLNCQAVNYPNIFVVGPNNQSSGVIVLNYQASCNLNVTGFYEPAFTFELYAEMGSTVSIDQWVLNGELQILKIQNITVLQNNVNSTIPFNVNGLINFLNLIANITFPTISQEIFGNGVPLPDDYTYVSLINSSVSIEQGYFYILSSPVFSFPASA